MSASTSLASTHLNWVGIIDIELKRLALEEDNLVVSETPSAPPNTPNNVSQPGLIQAVKKALNSLSEAASTGKKMRSSKCFHFNL